MFRDNVLDEEHEEEENETHTECENNCTMLTIYTNITTYVYAVSAPSTSRRLLSGTGGNPNQILERCQQNLKESQSGMDAGLGGPNQPNLDEVRENDCCSFACTL